MAKQASTTQPTNEFVEILMKNEWKKAEAEAKVAQLTEAISKKFPNAKPEFIHGTLKTAVNTLIRSKIEQIVGVCVGFSSKQDSNGFSKRKAYEIYEQDPVRAAQDKFVVVDAEGKVVFEKDEKGGLKKDQKGNPIPVAADNREFIDPDTKKMKNNRWGKALGENIQRDAYFIVDVQGKKKFVRAFGDFDVKMGYEYTIYGSMSAKGYISVPKTGPGVKGGKMVDDVDYWNIVNQTAQVDDLAVPLGDVNDIPKNKPVVTKGFVTTVRQAGSTIMVVLNDDTFPEGMVCFAADEGIYAEAETLGAGNEVIVIGRTMETVDKQNGGIRRSISMLGFASNPESDKIASAVRDLDDVLYT